MGDIREAFAKLQREQQNAATVLREAFAPHRRVIDQFEEQRALLRRMAENYRPYVARLSVPNEVAVMKRIAENAGSAFTALREAAKWQSSIMDATAALRTHAKAIAEIQRFRTPLMTLFDPDTAPLLEHYRRTSSYYSAAFRGFSKVQQAEVKVVAQLAALPVETATLASREVHLAGQVAVVAQVDVRSAFGKNGEPPGQDPGLLASLDELFATELPTLDSALTTMLAGAKEAIASRNPDRLRQASASIREFVKGVINTLAPEAAFKAWATKRNLNEKRIRAVETRVAYILRNSPTDPERSFYEVDVQQLRLLLNHFNAAVHVSKPDFAERDFAPLIRRVEGFVAVLIEVDRTYNRR